MTVPATRVDFAGIPASDFYYASLYRRADTRAKIRLVHALYQEISCIPHTVSDRGVARVKLDWWRQELQRFATDQARHQLTRALSVAAPRDPNLVRAGESLIRGLDDELQNSPRPDRNALERWYETTYAGVYQALAAGDGADPGVVGRQVETAYNLVNVRLLARRGLHRVPAASLDAAGCTWADIAAGRNRDGVRRLMEIEARHAVANLDTCITDRAAPSLRTLAILARQTMRECEHDGYQVTTHRVQLTPVKMLWLAWRNRHP